MPIHRIAAFVSSISVRKKVIGAAAVVVVAAGAAGGAYALWTTDGTGSGGAASGGTVDVTVTASAGPADLYPGFTAGDIYFTLTNTNDFPVTFTDAGVGTVTPADAVACPPENVTAIGATGLDLEVAANATSAQLSIADVVSMLESAPNGCQNMSFDIALTLTGAQS